jgi:hypothetical protein
MAVRVVRRLQFVDVDEQHPAQRLAFMGGRERLLEPA